MLPDLSFAPLGLRKWQEFRRLGQRAEKRNKQQRIRRNKAAIQDVEQAEWPGLVRALAIVDRCLTCNARLAYHLGK